MRSSIGAFPSCALVLSLGPHGALGESIVDSRRRRFPEMCRVDPVNDLAIQGATAFFAQEADPGRGEPGAAPSMPIVTGGPAAWGMPDI